MFKLELNQLKPLSFGASILGSGGGGNPEILLNLVEWYFNKYNTIDIISTNELDNSDLIVPLGLLGAPLVFLEKIPNLIPFEEIYKQITRDFPGRRIVLMPAEIGGSNALSPLLLAAKYNLPVLDGDFMTKPAVLHKTNFLPAYIADCVGNFARLNIKQNTQLLERVLRDIAINFGSAAVVAIYLFFAEQAQEYIIEGSITRALEIGLKFSEFETDSAKALPLMGGGIIAIGTIDHVIHTIKDGFLTGYVTIKTPHTSLIIYYQNEFLLAMQNEIVVASSPDIITLIDEQTGSVVTTDILRFGIKVKVILFESPPFWQDLNHKKFVDYKIFNLELQNENN
jgi:uncharacterized protein